LTFERVAKIAKLDQFAFGFCLSLQSLFIPASLRHMTGLSIAGCDIKSVTVDEENRLFTFCDDFLIDLGEMWLVRYCGHEKDVVVGSDIGVTGISGGCFRACPFLQSVTFESGCKVSILGGFAFAYCVSLESIWIPSSIETISNFCFSLCRRLSNVVFESGSRIAILDDSAFASCSSLELICIPSSIRSIRPDCFRDCEKLKLVFEAGCQLSAQSLSALRVQYEIQGQLPEEDILQRTKTN
jgi:hypothetical protein